MLASKGECWVGKIVESNYMKYIFNWVSNATGDVLYKMDKWDFSGQIWKVETKPFMTGGSTGPTPTIYYDITLVDQFAADLFLGLCLNRSSTTSEIIYVYDSTIPDLVSDCNTVANFTIANAGASKTGITIVYTQRGT